MLNIFNKDFLLGIGFGFLVSALLVNFLGSEKLTDSQIMDRATQLGMVYQESADIETDKTPVLPKENTVDDTEKNSNTEDVNIEKVNMPEQPEVVKFVIKAGTGSEKIARMLEEQGVVADRNKFYQLVTEKNAHRYFRTGTFNLPCGADMEQILEILTGK
ncbi:hypothetical protein [Phosphitispora sp. TUW77]|uniref:hypothetical protein n=1 Tax=Phosphitispora sp. TUW77 TaxID=3152361 RepID=UPI003AB3B62E